jgi:hypothetical protein
MASRQKHTNHMRCATEHRSTSSAQCAACSVPCVGTVEEASGHAPLAACTRKCAMCVSWATDVVCTYFNGGRRRKRLARGPLWRGRCECLLSLSLL